MKKVLVAALLLTSIQSFAQDNAQPPGPAASPRRQQSAQSDWKFAIGLGYSLGSKLKFDDAKDTTSSGTTSFSADLDFKNSYTLSFEGRNMPSNSWGFMGGIQFDGEREIDSVTLSSGGVTIKLNASDAKIQVTNLYANAVYRWEQFYLPFGINISSVKFTPASGSTGSTDVSGGVGAQLGVGAEVNDNFAVELFSRASAVKLKNSSSTTTTDYGTGYLSTLTLQGKYIF